MPLALYVSAGLSICTASIGMRVSEPEAQMVVGTWIISKLPEAVIASYPRVVIRTGTEWSLYRMKRT